MKELDNNGQAAHIDTCWNYGTSSYSITFAVTRQTGGWAVGDSYCTGQPATTIYTAPTGPCSPDNSIGATPTPGSVPGVPRTGGDSYSIFTLLAAFGGLALLGGLGLLLVGDASSRRAR